MAQTPKPPKRSRPLWAIVNALGNAGAILSTLLVIGSTAVSVVLAINSWVQPAIALAAALLIITGWTQWWRATRRLRRPEKAKIRRQIQAERGVAVFSSILGAALLAGAIAMPRWVELIVATLGCLALSVRSIKVAARTADAENREKSPQEGPVEECWCLGKLAEAAALVPVPWVASRFKALAAYKVEAGQIGVIQFATLCVIAVIFCGYATMSVASGLKFVVEHVGRSAGSAKGKSGRKKSGRGIPTYAEDCPALPDPLQIGHGLGRLFERDGAIKAGCGGLPFQVATTGAWVSVGLCDGELRSLAVAGPDEEGTIVYGAPARFAWQLALSGDLVRVETADPAGGDVDLVAGLGGTYGFTRPFPSFTVGKRRPRKCTEVSGVAEPFARLAPPMVLLWRDLLEQGQKSSWYWPVKNQGSSGATVTFVDSETTGVVATARCNSDTSCRMDIDGEAVPITGTAFVSEAELRPFMAFAR